MAVLASSMSRPMAHNIFIEHLPDLITVLMPTSTDLATRLWEKEWIGNTLYYGIVDKSGVATTNQHEMARAMLSAIHRALRQYNREEKWKGFIEALKNEPLLNGMVKKLGK